MQRVNVLFICLDISDAKFESRRFLLDHGESFRGFQKRSLTACFQAKEYQLKYFFSDKHWTLQLSRSPAKGTNCMSAHRTQISLRYRGV